MTVVKMLLDSVRRRRFGQSRLDKLILSAAYLLPAMGAIDKRFFTAAAILYLPIIIYMAFSDGLYCLYPILFFFYSQLVAPFGIVVFRIYTLVFILRTVYLILAREIRTVNVSKAVLAVFMLLTALRYMLFGGLVTIGVIIDLTFALCFSLEMGSGSERYSEFSKLFVFAAVISCIIGAFPSVGASEGTRYLATLNDPNYLGFFLNIAIITVFLHPFFKKIYIKLPLLAVLYTALVASESITGVIGNALVLIFCVIALTAMGRLKLKYLAALTLVIGVAVQIVCISQVKDWGIVTSASERVLTKIDALFLGDISGFTTSRSALWLINLEKLMARGGLSLVFGGGLVSAVGRDAALFPQTSHEEFIDVLISAGVIGAAVYILAVVFIFSEDIAKLRAERRSEGWMRLGVKLIWLFYALGLTMFMNAGLYIPFIV